MVPNPIYVLKIEKLEVVLKVDNVLQLVLHIENRNTFSPINPLNDTHRVTKTCSNIMLNEVTTCNRDQQAQSSSFVLDPCLALSHIWKLIFPESRRGAPPPQRPAYEAPSKNPTLSESGLR